MKKLRKSIIYLITLITIVLVLVMINIVRPFSKAEKDAVSASKKASSVTNINEDNELQITANNAINNSQNLTNNVSNNSINENTANNKTSNETENSVQNTVSNTTEDATQNKVENKVSNNAVETTQNKTENQVSNNKEETTQNKLENQALNNTEETTQNKAGNQISNNTEETTQNKSENQVSNNTEEISQIDTETQSSNEFEQATENENQSSNSTEEDDEIPEEEFTLYALSESFDEGNGTAAAPYEISSIADLQLLAQVVTNHTADTTNGGYFNTKYYKLTCDIDFENGDITPIGQIDTNNSNFTFQGNFNGDGYKISNGNIVVNQISSTDKNKYGLFAGLYSSTPSKKCAVYNLELDNINVHVTANQNITKDTVIGVLAGHIGQNSSITNCIVKNSSIVVDNTLKLVDSKQLAIGGFVGDVSRDSTANGSAAMTSGSEPYIIDNCYADVDITLNNETWSTTKIENFYQTVVGGFVGRIRYQDAFPTNCIYTGTLKAKNAFISPIYANMRYDIGSGTATFKSAYLGIKSNGKSAGNMENCYFYNYSIDNGTVTQINSNYKDVLTETKLDTITGYCLDLVDMHAFQGVNRGEFLGQLSQGYTMFNNHQGIGDRYKQWYYDFVNDSLTFTPIEANINVELIKNYEYNYTAQVTGIPEGEDFSYEWYLNNVLQECTEDTFTIPPENFKSDTSLTVAIKQDDTIVAAMSTFIPEKMHRIFVQIQTENGVNTLQPILNTELGFSLDDFTLSWYKLNSATSEYEFMSSDQEYELPSSAALGDQFKLIAIHNDDSLYDLERTYVYSDVIYVTNAITFIDDVIYPERKRF